MFPCSVPTSWELEKGASCRGVWRTLCSYLKFKYPGEHPRPEESIPDLKLALAGERGWEADDRPTSRYSCSVKSPSPDSNFHVRHHRVYILGLALAVQDHGRWWNTRTRPAYASVRWVHLFLFFLALAMSLVTGYMLPKKKKIFWKKKKEKWPPEVLAQCRRICVRKRTNGKWLADVSGQSGVS